MSTFNQASDFAYWMTARQHTTNTIDVLSSSMEAVSSHPVSSSSMSTFHSFLLLPLEIQILIFRHYLRQWSFDITVSQSPIIPSNFRIGTGCPFNFNFRAAGSKADLCAIWTSRDLHEPARKALEQSYTGTAILCTPGGWHYPQRKPMFCNYVLPGLPGKMIRKLVLAVTMNGSMAQMSSKTPRGYTSWAELTEFVKLEELPNLECLRIRMTNLAAFKFSLDEVGDVLRGSHDNTVAQWLRSRLPSVRARDPRELTAHDGRAVTLEVETRDTMTKWVPTWRSQVAMEHAASMCLLMRGKNTEDLMMLQRTLRTFPFKSMSDILIVDGESWETEAIARWPHLRLVDGRLTSTVQDGIFPSGVQT